MLGKFSKRCFGTFTASALFSLMPVSQTVKAQGREIEKFFEDFLYFMDEFWVNGGNMNDSDKTGYVRKKNTEEKVDHLKYYEQEITWVKDSSGINRKRLKNVINIDFNAGERRACVQIRDDYKDSIYYDFKKDGDLEKFKRDVKPYFWDQFIVNSSTKLSSLYWKTFSVSIDESLRDFFKEFRRNIEHHNCKDTVTLNWNDESKAEASIVAQVDCADGKHEVREVTIDKDYITFHCYRPVDYNFQMYKKNTDALFALRDWAWNTFKDIVNNRGKSSIAGDNNIELGVQQNQQLQQQFQQNFLQRNCVVF